jgi:hypothetical protein
MRALHEDIELKLRAGSWSPRKIMDISTDLRPTTQQQRHGHYGLAFTTNRESCRQSCSLQTRLYPSLRPTSSCTLSLPKTAFRTHRGTLLHLTMQLGDNNAISTQLPESAVEEARDKTAMYVDDVIPVSDNTSNEHYASLCMILKIHHAEKLFFVDKKPKLFIEDDEPLKLLRSEIRRGG